MDDDVMIPIELAVDGRAVMRVEALWRRSGADGGSRRCFVRRGAQDAALGDWQRAISMSHGAVWASAAGKSSDFDALLRELDLLHASKAGIELRLASRVGRTLTPLAIASCFDGRSDYREIAPLPSECLERHAALEEAALIELEAVEPISDPPSHGLRI